LLKKSSNIPASRGRDAFLNEKSKRDFWQAEVTKMIELCGAPVDKADVPKIVDYLSSTY
jgi:hypothetical protein